MWTATIGCEAFFSMHRPPLALGLRHRGGVEKLTLGIRELTSAPRIDMQREIRTREYSL